MTYLKLESIKVTVPYEFFILFQGVVLDLSRSIRADLTVRDINKSPRKPRRTEHKFVGIYHFKVFPQHRAEVLQFAENLYTIWRLTRNT